MPNGNLPNGYRLNDSPSEAQVTYWQRNWRDHGLSDIYKILPKTLKLDKNKIEPLDHHEKSGYKNQLIM